MELAEFLTNSFWGTVIRSPLRLLPRNADVPDLKRPSSWQALDYWFAPACLLVRHLRNGAAEIDHAETRSRIYFLRRRRQCWPVHPPGSQLCRRWAVIAFEPVPANVASLRKHIGLNRLENVTVFDVAVSDRSGSTSFATGIPAPMDTYRLRGIFKFRPRLSMDSFTNKMSRRRTSSKWTLKEKSSGRCRAPESALPDFVQNCSGPHGKNVHEECCRLLQSWHYDIAVLENWEAERATLHATPTAIIGESRS